MSSNVLFLEGLVSVLKRAKFSPIVAIPDLDKLNCETLTSTNGILFLVDVGSEFQVKLQQIEALRLANSTARIAIFGEHMRRTDVVTALRAGVNACFAHVSTCDTLLKALELVMLGESVVQPVLWALKLEGEPIADENDDEVAGSPRLDPRSVSIIEIGDHEGDRIAIATGVENVNYTNGVSCIQEDEPPLSPDFLPMLSPRQRFILQCLVQGDSNKHIARKIAVSEGTVKCHIKVLLRKTKVHNRTQAAIWALNHQSYLISVQ